MLTAELNQYHYAIVYLVVTVSETIIILHFDLIDDLSARQIVTLFHA